MTIEQELIEQKLFELVEAQSFDSLSTEEREFVLRQISKEEYNVQQESIHVITEIEKENLQVASRNVIQEYSGKESSWIGIFSTILKAKIPAVALVLPTLFLVGIMVFKNTSNLEIEAVKNTDSITVIDSLKTVEDSLIAVVDDTILLLEPKQIAEQIIYSNTSSSPSSASLTIAKAKTAKPIVNGINMKDNSYSKYVQPIYTF